MRVVLRIGGRDRHAFLQNLVTNDVPDAPGALAYAALLSPQGKYLADFFLQETGDAILLDADAGQAPGLAKRLAMYKLRADVAVETTEMPVGLGTGASPEGALPDPRHPDMGWRHYGGAGDGTEFDAIRVRHCIPEAGIELIENDSYILESGFERLNGVNFKKGCYVGQEVTARMKHKTTLRKGLATVHLSGTAPVGTAIEADGKAVGTLFTAADDQAIAYLRFDRAGPDMAAGAATVSYVSG